MNCSFCKGEAIDSTDFEVGNNAEIGITVRLCANHLKEVEDDDYAFQDKYADRLEELGMETMGVWGDSHD